MKLATALSERADLQKRISELSVRLNNNAKVQEGEAPSEDPSALLLELDGCLTRLEELMARINKTNQETRQGGVTITDLEGNPLTFRAGATSVAAASPGVASGPYLPADFFRKES